MMEQKKTSKESTANPFSQLLQFCEPCGLKRICEVTDKLQKLFTDRCVLANTCCLCCKEVSDDSEITKGSLPLTIKPENISVSAQTAATVIDQNLPTNLEVDHCKDDDDDNEHFALANLNDEDDTDNDNSTVPDEDNISETSKINVASELVLKTPEVVLQKLKMESESVLIDSIKENDTTVPTVKKTGRGCYKRKRSKKYKKVQPATTNTEKVNEAPKKKRKKKVMPDREQIDLSLLNTPEVLRERSTRLKTGAIQAAKYAAMVEDPKLTSSEDEDQERPKKKIEDDIDPDIKELMEMSEMSESEVSDEEARPQYGTRYLDPEILEHVNPQKDDLKFECKHCEVQFSNLHPFLRHISSHTGKPPLDKPFRCDHCSDNFDYKSFCSHKKTHQNYIFKCPYRGCKYIFRSRASLWQHKSVHRGNRPYFCKQCGVGFYTQDQQKAHVSEHVDETHRCNECHLVFSDLYELKQHHRQAHEVLKKIVRPKVYKCKECHACTVTTKSHLQRHMQEMHGAKTAPHKCIKCKALFPSRAMLTAHLEHDFCEPDVEVDIKESIKNVDPRLIAMIGRPRSADKPFRCKHCVLKEFNSAHMFMKHLQKSHANLATDCPVTHAYICDQCNKKFKGRDRLSNHILTHTDYRPFACPIEGCDKKFKSQAMLDMHTKNHDKKPIGPEDWKFICPKCGIRKPSLGKLIAHDNSVHLRLRPAVCQKCGKGFSSTSKLTTHVRRVHEQLRPWVCEVCGKAYKERNELTTHTYTHTGQKPFACQHCEYRCTRVDYLKKHIRIHTGEKPYVCDVCKDAFSNRTSLNIHMRKHRKSPTGGKPYVCDVCKDAFSNRISLTNHMKKHKETIRNELSDDTIASAMHAAGAVPSSSTDHSFGPVVGYPVVDVAGVASASILGHVSTVTSDISSDHAMSSFPLNIPTTASGVETVAIAAQFLEAALGGQFSHGSTYTNI